KRAKSEIYCHLFTFGMMKLINVVLTILISLKFLLYCVTKTRDVRRCLKPLNSPIEPFSFKIRNDFVDILPDIMRIEVSECAKNEKGQLVQQTSEWIIYAKVMNKKCNGRLPLARTPQSVSQNLRISLYEGPNKIAFEQIDIWINNSVIFGDFNVTGINTGLDLAMRFVNFTENVLLINKK
ncbi:hypothetical protein MXB_4857, partial [Myxobolus squamalis]